jgi:hypothetical protein
MPEIFFKHSMIFLVTVSSLINGLICMIFRKFRHRPPS